MTTRHLYIARHGEADAFGTLTETGHRQAALLGERLAHLPITTVWHSPLPRATASAIEITEHFRNVVATEVDELIDNIPYVPSATDMPPSWAGFFDGYDEAEARAGRQRADALIARFTTTHEEGDTHEVLVTHDYPIAWLLRHALDAPPSRWLGLSSANTALTVIEYRPGQPPAIIMFNDMSHLPPICDGRDSPAR